MKNSVFSNFDCDPEIMLKWLQHYGNLRYISPQKTLWSTFYSTKKKKSVRLPKIVVFRFWDRTWNPFQEWKFFFLKIQLTRIFFWGEIYRELPCRRNHYIIILGSRSNVEKTMKSSVFSNFDCDPEIMLKWLQHYGNLRWISPRKTQSSTFYSTKINKSVRHHKIVVSRFWDRTWNPFQEW